jgi:hypothetical protein
MEKKVKVKRKIFFDDKGVAVGMGEETTYTEPVRGKIGHFTEQTTLSGLGANTQRFEEVDEATLKDIADPNKKLSLKSFNKTRR